MAIYKTSQPPASVGSCEVHFRRDVRANLCCPPDGADDFGERTDRRQSRAGCGKGVAPSDALDTEIYMMYRV